MRQPSLAALRAINQYRRRDIIPYLALRYYLANSAARGDLWAAHVAPDVTRRHSVPRYLRVRNFKGRDEDGKIEHRDLFLPTPSEALAEASLLDACSRSPRFRNPRCVYSYPLATGDDHASSFGHFMDCIRERHAGIAAACDAFPQGRVQYLDIKRFYPSISIQDARRCWETASAELSSSNRAVGSALLEQHSVVSGGKLLTGPIFSHVIGNLVLRNVDEQMCTDSGLAYFRYVDDVVLVGSQARVEGAIREVEAALDGLGLQIHRELSDKWLNISTTEWLEGRADFEDRGEGDGWKSLIGGLKWLLVERPDASESIRTALAGEGFRIPILNYGAAVREQAYLSRLKQLVRRRWYWRRKRPLNEIGREAGAVRRDLVSRLDATLSHLVHATDYGRKRYIPKARYFAGRLLYLATHQQLASFAERLRQHPDLAFHATLYEAVATGDVTQAVLLGADVTQGVAQALRAEGRGATFQGPVDGDVASRGLAILAMNGVEVRGAGFGPWENDPLLEIARTGVSEAHFSDPDQFIRTFASLHGISDPRHPQVLGTAFHASDATTFDAVSSYMQDS